MAVHGREGIVMNFYADNTLQELLEERKEIHGRPFPSGWSGEECVMMQRLENFCTERFGEVVEQLGAVAEWIKTGKVDGVGMDAESVLDSLEETLVKAHNVDEITEGLL